MHKYIFTLGLILTSIYTTTTMADWPETAVKLATDVWTSSSHITPAEMHCADCCKTNCWLPNGTYYDSMGKFTENCGDEPNPPTCMGGAGYGVVNGTCKITSCPAGYFLPSGAVVCQGCPIDNYCPEKSTTPTPCTNAPANAQYTDSGVSTSNCPWECKSGYTKSGSTCVANCSGYKIGSGSFACVDPSINGKAKSNINFDGRTNGNTPALSGGPGTWGVQFDYGDVTGLATCNDNNGDGEYAATPNTGFTSGTTGGHCWCRMTSPTKSQWVYHSNPDSTCASSCAAACMNSVYSNSTMREALYEHLGN